MLFRSAKTGRKGSALSCPLGVFIYCAAALEATSEAAASEAAILTADDEEICSIIGKASDEQTIKIIDIESALIGRIKSYGMVDDAKVIVSFNGKNAVIAANIYRGDKSFRCEVKGEDVYIERMMDKLVRQILHKLA